MPDREIEPLYGRLAQAGGKLEKRAPGKKFRVLTEEETIQVEILYDSLFGEVDRKAV